MKILIINNNTRHMSALSQSLASHDVEIRDYKPGVDFSCADKDLIILSGGGGEGLEIHDEHQPGKLWYEDEMKFVLACQKPIIGICMGFEVISRAFDASVEKMSQGVNGFMELTATDEGKRLFNSRKLIQFEAHDWCVRETPKEFDVLARSKGGVEIIKHKTKRIFATQFHPEKGGTLSLKSIINY